MNRSTLGNSLRMYAIFGMAWCTSGRAAYPEARQGTQVDDYFGVKVTDPYRWMEDIDSPETAAWVKAERVATAAALEQVPERAVLKTRLKELWNFPKFGLPIKRGGDMFYRKNDGLQNQAVLYVAGADGAAPRVLIDPNTLSSEGTVAITAVSPTDDGKLLGYGVAVSGSDWNEFHVRDVTSGKDLPDVVRWVKFSDFSWTHDGAGFFYSRFPELAKGDKLFGKLSGRQLYYHRLGTVQSADHLVFELKEHPDWFFGGSVTDDGRYLIIDVQQNGKTETALYYIDLGDPSAPRLDGRVVKLLDAFDAQYIFLGNQEAVFYVSTTLSAPRGRVVAISLVSPHQGTWRTVVAQTEDSIDDAGLVGGRLVIATLHDVQSHLYLYTLGGGERQEVVLPGIGSLSGLSGRADEPELFYDFSSFLTPHSILCRDLNTGTQRVFEAPPTPFDPSRFETTELFYSSRDGTRIPMFVTARKGLKRDGSSAAWLYGYGGFNVSIVPSYSVPPAVWVEMGGIYVQANIRGGSEYGEAWHLAGTKERKQNVFDDFIAAADFLVAHGYTQRDRLVIEGRSNGGLLIGAVLNQHPEMCAVALPQVGVMDMLRFHKFTVGSAWVSDYGSSDDAAGFGYLRAYSPLHNVKAGVKYPAVMITTGDHDDRVFPAHSFKYAATLQRVAGAVAGSGPILIRIESDAGHGGSSGTSPVSKTIEEWADKMGFAAHYMPAGVLTLPRDRLGDARLSPGAGRAAADSH